MRDLGFFSFGVLFGIALLIGLFRMQVGIPTSSSKWAHDLYLLKERHARSTPTEKLLIVAGSNSLFGISAEKIEQKYSIPTTNFGVHAGLGLRYILERSKRSLRAGDIVYLPLEYALYQQESTPSAQLMDFLLARDPRYLDSLPVAQRLLGYTHVSFDRVFQGLRGGSDRYEGRSAGIYNVSNVDKSGNQTNNAVDLGKAFSAKLMGLQPKDIGIGEISNYSRETLAEYFSWAKAHNVCVIGAPPNLLYFKAYQSKNFIDFFREIQQVYRDHDVSFAGTPMDYLLSNSYFFDTEYHLNKSGVEFRTKLTIRDLGEHLRAHCT